MFETQTNHQFKILKFVNGIEFTSKIFKTHCTTYGIQHIIIYSFQQTMVAKHKNITLVEFAWTILKVTQMPNGFQGETIVTSNYFQNRLNIHQGYGKLHI